MKSKLIGCFLCILSSAFFGCARENSDTRAAFPDVPFVLGFHQTAFVQDVNLQIEFSDIVNDSRCPANVDCVWEGMLTIKVNIQEGTKDLGDFTISDHDDLRTDNNIPGHKIAMRGMNQTVKENTKVCFVVVGTSQLQPSQLLQNCPREK